MNLVFGNPGKSLIAVLGIGFKLKGFRNEREKEIDSVGVGRLLRRVDHP